MSRHAIGSSQFDAPAEWSSRAVLVFIGRPVEGDPTPSITVGQEEKGAREGIQSHVWRRLFELSRRTADFALLQCEDAKVDGRAAMRTRYRWTTDGAPREQVVTWIDAPEGSALTVTCTTPGAPEALEAFERVLSSIHFVGGDVRAPRESMIVSAPPPPPERAPPPPPERAPSPSSPSVDAFAELPSIPMPGARQVRR